MYVVDHTQECHVECRYIPDIGMGHMTLICVSHSLTHSDTLDSDIVRRSLVMEMKVGDAGPSQLGYYNTKQLV